LSAVAAQPESAAASKIAHPGPDSRRIEATPIARSKSSGRWLQRHVKDPYVRKARDEGYRSRAAYKLLEINTRDRLLIPGAKVVDLGAAPGGWSQVAAAKIGPSGRVVAVDLLEIAPMSGVTVLQGDFRTQEVQARVAAALGGGKADLVLSDMSPNISGIASADQARAAELVRLAMAFCRENLAPQGAFLAKVFQGEEFTDLLKEMRVLFREVRALKPSASREESRETYLLARGLKGLQ
jgi:23S rRNA (uridine2552-2'-O)-methyltransferase